MLLQAERFLDRLELFRSHARSGVAKHLQEPVDLPGLEGMADTTAMLSIRIGGPNGVDDQFTVTIQEREKWNEVGPTQAKEQGIGPRGVGFF